MAGVVGIAAGLWASGLGMSCVVRHPFDGQELDCPGFFRPQCCDSCVGPAVSDPVCTEQGWTCLPPSVNSFTCPSPSPFCQTPVVNPDAGGCADGGVLSEETYAAPGCSQESLVCPNDGTLRCALRKIQAQHDACQLTADCVPAPPPARNCTGWGTCPPFAVHSAQLGAFLAEEQAEVDRYCACPTCAWSTMCPGVDAGVARCVSGHCTWVSGPVAYACADRRTGACFSTCAADEACYTQVVACTPLGDGGCLPMPVDAGVLPGDDLCHLRCAADGGCPEGQSCFLAAFNGCRSVLLDGGTPVTPICCAADAGCVSQ
jgi:hypothetical protein